MKNKFYKYLEQFCEYLVDIKNYSPLTIKTYKTPILNAIQDSEIYEENNHINFDITKYRIDISTQNPKTINKKISAVKSFVRFLTDKELTIKLIGANSIKTAQTLPKPIQTNNIFESLKNLSI